MDLTVDVLICGAGIAGVSAAYHLAQKHGVRDILLVDQNSPLSLTSDHSTECYRNWWPGPGGSMVALMNRSLDIIERLAIESNNVFNLNRRGYLYSTADPSKVADLINESHTISQIGAGPLRIHKGGSIDHFYQPAQPHAYWDQSTGADLITETDLIHKHFPYLTEDVVAVLHVRRAGWLSAQQLGMYLLESAKSHGVKFLQNRVTDIDTKHGCIASVRLEDGTRIRTKAFINAAGPNIREVAQMVGIDLPVYSELHLKVAFKDHLNVLDRDAPMLIWNDAQYLPWNSDERGLLIEDVDFQWMLGEMPPGVHTRPEGGADSQIILMLWEYCSESVEPAFPIPIDSQYPEIVLRGLVKMLPGLQSYIGKAPKPVIDGGYYTKTRENRPLIGKLPIEGVYVLGALSGFGIMASPAAGELLAAQVTGSPLPPYAPSFSIDRYDDPQYQRLLESWDAGGQL
jgi:glycine/D-amino acid oxidase-like deaminating enzyme